MRSAAAIAGFVLAFAGAAQAKPPVIVELYTSQGCASCTEANSLVEALAEREGLIPLTFTVDYWDYLGWRDTFAKPEFAARQRTYAERLASGAAVYTPQVVIDGAAEAKAAPATVERLISSAAKAPRDPPDLQFLAGKVLVGSGKRPAKPADVWLIRYDPRGQEVEVRSGENRGKTITYRNVVSQLVRLGAWGGRASAYGLPEAPQDGLETLILVQQPGGGPVVALLND